MIDDKNKGIANLLAEYRPPVRTQKVETQEDPIVTLSETLMRIEPIELPKSEPKSKRRPVEGSYTDQYNKYFNKKSDQYYKNQIPKKKTDVMNYVNKMTEIYDGPRIDPPILKANINNRYVNKSLNSFENRTDKKDVVTFDPTTQLFTDETRNIAFKSYDQAKRWNDAVNSEDKKDTRKNENVKKINPNRRLI